MISDAKWYIDRCSGPDRDFYDIFFQMCQKYNVSWGSASEKEKAFIEEVTRVTYEVKLAKENRMPLSEVRPSFSK